MKIGQILNVFGRSVVLVDCDKFTREYYQKKYGIEEFVPIERPKDTRWNEACVEKIMPPYNGWGSFEDSEASCNSIQPKAPQRDMKKFRELDNCNLRFRAQMISKIAEDNDREFVITYYLSDDTISVFELGKRNASSSVILFQLVVFELQFKIQNDYLGRFSKTWQMLLTPSKLVHQSSTRTVHLTNVLYWSKCAFQRF